VEQRNHFLVRAYIGYDRLDTVAQTILLNTIYQKMWIYHNLFLPVMREEIYELIEELYSLPNAMPGVSEDVYETLGLPIDLPAGLLGSVTLSFEPQPLQSNFII